VVLISIDTLRSDRLPLYGYRAGSTPALDALGREGIVFEDVFSHCPLTLPAHASLFTGLLPPRHGVRDNIGFTLKDAHPTLATRFKRAGWPTGGAVSAYVLRTQTGISRGFDFDDDALEIEGAGDSLGSVQRDGGVAVESLARWIEGQGGRRFFAFLHLYEPHSPYRPPEAHRGHGQPYDGEVSYADELVGRFLERLKARGVYDGAVIAVTSDHGEGLKDHREEEHGIFLYREAVQVPLIMRLPGGARAGTRIGGTVGQVDIPATLVDLAGLPPQGMDGASLRPALAAGTAASKPVYSETLFPRYHFGWSDLYAVTDGRFRYVRAPRPELFDLATDPAETRNIVDSRTSAAAAMDHWLEGRVSAAELAAPDEVSPDTREKLQALGYIGVGTVAPPPGLLPDPKDKIGSYEDLKRALALRRDGQGVQAVAQFRRVLAENPRMLDAWEMMGLTLAGMGRTEEGVAALVKALEIDPSRPATHLTLARIYALEGKVGLATSHAEIASGKDPAKGFETLAQLMLDRGRLQEAAAFAGKSVQADDQRMMSHFVLGVVFQRAGRCEEAVVSFRKAEQAKKRQQQAVLRSLHYNMGDCLARLGREAEAEQEFLAEIEALPRSPQGRVGLAMLYRSQGRDAEVRAVLAGLLAADPQPSADAYWTVVRTLSVLGDAAAARQWAGQARSRFPSDPRFQPPPGRR
jgi:arylsulfatase A-like enzyme/Tfp pilus assembly protein PilF